MIKTLTKCDFCGKKAKSYGYIYDKHMDISGNGYENDWKYLDLCLTCKTQFEIDRPEIKLIGR